MHLKNHVALYALKVLLSTVVFSFLASRHLKSWPYNQKSTNTPKTFLASDMLKSPRWITHMQHVTLLLPGTIFIKYYASLWWLRNKKPQTHTHICVKYSYIGSAAGNLRTRRVPPWSPIVGAISWPLFQCKNVNFPWNKFFQTESMTSLSLIRPPL